MRFRSKPAFIVLLLLGGLFSTAATDSNGFHLQTLAGNWEGEGEVVIPKTSIPLSIEGKAVFSYDSVTARLRTQIEASKFLFTYADSGYIYHDTATDSISWDIWDGFGRFSRYIGTVDNNVITGAKMRHGYRYQVKIDFITDDSLNFTLTTTGKDGKSSTRADITMWRTLDE